VDSVSRGIGARNHDGPPPPSRDVSQAFRGAFISPSWTRGIYYHLVRRDTDG